jgi:hypothetical protein
MQPSPPLRQPRTEAEFLDEIQAKVLRVFLLAIHSKLYTALPLEIYISSNPHNLLQFLAQLLYTVKEKGDNLIENHTPLSMVAGILTESSRLCPETSTKLDVHEFGFRAACSNTSKDFIST